MAINTFINYMLYVFLIIEIILLIYYRKVLLSLIKELLGKKQKDPKSEYEQVKSYIIKELNKGFTLEQIKETLLKADWDKEMIEMAINESNIKRITSE